MSASWYLALPPTMHGQVVPTHINGVDYPLPTFVKVEPSAIGLWEEAVFDGEALQLPEKLQSHYFLDSSPKACPPLLVTGWVMAIKSGKKYDVMKPLPVDDIVSLHSFSTTGVFKTALASKNAGSGILYHPQFGNKPGWVPLPPPAPAPDPDDLSLPFGET